LKDDEEGTKNKDKQPTKSKPNYRKIEEESTKLQKKKGLIPLRDLVTGDKEDDYI